MPLPADFIDRLKAANPISDVMGSYVTLKRTGRDYVCLCPFHNEKTPSCYVHPDKEFFHCFGCGAGGDVITFTMKYNNLDYWEAVKLLAERGGVPLPEDNLFRNNQGVDKRKRIYEMNKKAARFFFDQLKSDAGKGCREYLIKRGLRAKTIQKYGMGFAPNSWNALKNYMLGEGYSEDELIEASLISRSQRNTKNTYDFFVNRAMFPFIDLRGNIVGFGGRALSDEDKRKYLNSKDTPVYQKNRFLFSMCFAKNAAVKERKIILCEGNLDVISLNQAGFENAVASCGTALTPEQVKLISNYADEVIICYDSDEAGQKATRKAINLIGESGVKTTVIKMNGAKDPDEYINKFGSVQFKYLLDNADGAINFELNRCKEGLDLESDLGKIDYMKRVYEVLSQIKSPVERDVYISKISNEQNINRESIAQEVDFLIRKKRNAKIKREDRELISHTQRRRDVINPESAVHYKESKAEEGIIFYLFNNPDKFNEIDEKISEEKFVTSFNRRLFKAICDRIENNEDYSISSLNSEFSPDEMGKITSILEKYNYMGIDEKVVDDYIKLLNNFSTKVDSKEEMSNEDFLNLRNTLKAKKS